MTEMIERVAQELCAASRTRRGEALEWDGRRINRSYWRRQARAAIEATREPPRPLLTVSAKAALLARGSGCSQEDAFLAGLRAMINAALETPPE